jgi:hypothetical protein
MDSGSLNVNVAFCIALSNETNVRMYLCVVTLPGLISLLFQVKIVAVNNCDREAGLQSSDERVDRDGRRDMAAGIVELETVHPRLYVVYPTIVISLHLQWELSDTTKRRNRSVQVSS